MGVSEVEEEEGRPRKIMKENNEAQIWQKTLANRLVIRFYLLQETYPASADCVKYGLFSPTLLSIIFL